MIVAPIDINSTLSNLLNTYVILAANESYQAWRFICGEKYDCNPNTEFPTLSKSTTNSSQFGLQVDSMGKDFFLILMLGQETSFLLCRKLITVDENY